VSRKMAVGVPRVAEGDNLRHRWRGYKAGGFIPRRRPAPKPTVRTQLNYEGGREDVGVLGSAVASIAAFRIDWKDVQCHVPNVLVPASSSSRRGRRHEQPASSSSCTRARHRGSTSLAAPGSRTARSRRQPCRTRETSAATAGERAKLYRRFGVQYSRPLRGELAMMARGPRRSATATSVA